MGFQLPSVAFRYDLLNILGYRQQHQFAFDLYVSRCQEPHESSVMLQLPEGPFRLDRPVDSEELPFLRGDSRWRLLTVFGQLMTDYEFLLFFRILRFTARLSIRTFPAILASVPSYLALASVLALLRRCSDPAQDSPVLAKIVISRRIIAHVFGPADLTFVFPRSPAFVVVRLDVCFLAVCIQICTARPCQSSLPESAFRCIAETDLL